MSQRSTSIQTSNSGRRTEVVERLRVAHGLVLVLGLVLISCGGAG